MHRVLDLRTIDGFRFGTLLLSQARYLFLDSRIEIPKCARRLQKHEADPILDLHEIYFFPRLFSCFFEAQIFLDRLSLLAIILVERKMHAVDS